MELELEIVEISFEMDTELELDNYWHYILWNYEQKVTPRELEPGN